MERNIEIVKISIEVVEYSIEFLKKNMSHGEECKMFALFWDVFCLLQLEDMSSEQ